MYIKDVIVLCCLNMIIYWLTRSWKFTYKTVQQNVRKHWLKSNWHFSRLTIRHYVNVLLFRLGLYYRRKVKTLLTFRNICSADATSRCPPVTEVDNTNQGNELAEVAYLSVFDRIWPVLPFYGLYPSPEI